MKSYDIKYEVGDDIYILESKRIYKSKIDKIRVIESNPYTKLEKDGSLTPMDGVNIDYLVTVSDNGNFSSHDWRSQDDVFLDKEELIRKIK